MNRDRGRKGKKKKHRKRKGKKKRIRKGSVHNNFFF